MLYTNKMKEFSISKSIFDFRVKIERKLERIRRQWVISEEICTLFIIDI